MDGAFVCSAGDVYKRQVKLYPRIVDRENTFPVIAVIKVLDHFLKMGFVRIHGAKCGVCGQRVIDVVRRA